MLYHLLEKCMCPHSDMHINIIHLGIKGLPPRHRFTLSVITQRRDFKLSFIKARDSHIHMWTSSVKLTFHSNFCSFWTCTSENFILSLEVKSSKSLKSTYTVTHTHTLTLQMYSHYYCARNTIKEVLCLHVYSPEQVIYSGNLPLSFSPRNRTLSTSECSSADFRGRGLVVQQAFVSVSSFSYLCLTLNSPFLKPVNLKILSMHGYARIFVSDGRMSGNASHPINEWDFARINIERNGVTCYRAVITTRTRIL